MIRAIYLHIILPGSHQDQVEDFSQTMPGSSQGPLILLPILPAKKDHLLFCSFPIFLPNPKKVFFWPTPLVFHLWKPPCHAAEDEHFRKESPG